MAVATITMTSANAQWLNYPAPGTPLTRDGKPNLAAKTPRARNGKADLSGVWQIEPAPAGEMERLYPGLSSGVGGVDGDDPLTQSRHFFNLLIDFKPGEEPIRPEAAARAAKSAQTRIALHLTVCLTACPIAISSTVPSKSSRLPKRSQSSMSWTESFVKFTPMGASFP